MPRRWHSMITSLPNSPAPNNITFVALVVRAVPKMVIFDPYLSQIIRITQTFAFSGSITEFNKEKNSHSKI
ncbi:hypothetical protein ACS7FE_15895 [Proteus mirabilis]|uniref:hypothetical protein n=1 Tax=Proteus mirabilis TaxID=584 RepID=UPI003F4203B0